MSPSVIPRRRSNDQRPLRPGRSLLLPQPQAEGTEGRAGETETGRPTSAREARKVVMRVDAGGSRQVADGGSVPQLTEGHMGALTLKEGRAFRPGDS